MKGNSSSEHLIVVKTWMKTNKVGEKNLYVQYGEILRQGGAYRHLAHNVPTQGKISTS